MTQAETAFITAAIGALVAIWGVLIQRQITRRRATFDLLSKSDPELSAARRKFAELAKAPEGLAPWADLDKETTLEAQAIAAVLNSFEQISVCIQHNTLDYKTYRMLRRTIAISFWKHGYPFVAALRARLKNDMIYHEFEEMIKWLKGEERPPINW
jgi:Domain of unknown function (DUF4760)